MRNYIVVDGLRYRTPAIAWKPITKKPMRIRKTLLGEPDVSYGVANYKTWEGEIEAPVTPDNSSWGGIDDLRTSIEKMSSILFVDHFGNICLQAHIEGPFSERSLSNKWDAADNKMYLTVRLYGVLDTYSAKLLAMDPVAYYPLLSDGVDFGSNGYHGTLVGAVMQDGTNPQGYACPYFDGVDDYLDVYSLAPGWNGDEYVIAGWYKQTSAALVDGDWHDMPVFYNADLSKYVFTRSQNGSFYAMRNAGTSQGWSPLSAGQFGSAWRHLAFKCSLTEGVLTTYNNGVKGASFTPSGNWSGGNSSSGSLFGASAGASKIHLWEGWMSHVGVWPSLTDAQVLSLATL